MFRRGVLDTTLCSKFVCDMQQVGGFLQILQFPPPNTNKNDLHDITEILLKVALNTITLTLNPPFDWAYLSVI